MMKIHQRAYGTDHLSWSFAFVSRVFGQADGKDITVAKESLTKVQFRTSYLALYSPKLFVSLFSLLSRPLHGTTSPFPASCRRSERQHPASQPQEGVVFGGSLVPRSSVDASLCLAPIQSLLTLY